MHLSQNGWDASKHLANNSAAQAGFVYSEFLYKNVSVVVVGLYWL